MESYSKTQATTTTSIYNETQQSRPYRFFAPNSWVNDVIEYEKKGRYDVYELTKDITTSVYEMGNSFKEVQSNVAPPANPENANKEATLLKYNYKGNVAGSNNQSLDIDKMRQYLNDLDCPKNIVWKNEDGVDQSFFNINELNNDNSIQKSRLSGAHKNWALFSIDNDSSKTIFKNTKKGIRNNIFPKTNYSITESNSRLLNTTKDVYGKLNEPVQILTSNQTGPEITRDGETRFLVSVTEISKNILVSIREIVNKDSTEKFIYLNESLPHVMDGVTEFTLNVEGYNYKITKNNESNSFSISANAEIELDRQYSLTEDNIVGKGPVVRKMRSPLERDYDLMPFVSDSNKYYGLKDVSGNLQRYDGSGNITEGFNTLDEMLTKYNTSNSNEIIDEWVGSILKQRNIDIVNYDIMDTDNDGVLVYKDDDERNIEEAIIKMNNAWLPSTKPVPLNDPSGIWQWNDISGNEHKLLRDTLGSDKWGNIRSYDYPLNKIYTGCQITGRAYNYVMEGMKGNNVSSGSWVTNLGKEDLLYNLRQYNITKENGAVNFSQVDTDITSDDVPICYNIDTIMRYDNIFTKNSEGNVYALPVCDHIDDVLDVDASGGGPISKGSNYWLRLDRTTNHNDKVSTNLSANQIWDTTTTNHKIPRSKLSLSTGNVEFSQMKNIDKYTNNRFMDKYTMDYITSIKIKVTEAPRLMFDDKTPGGSVFSKSMADITNKTIKYQGCPIYEVSSNSNCGTHFTTQGLVESSGNHLFKKSTNVGGDVSKPLVKYHMMDGFDISIKNLTNNMGEGWKTSFMVDPGCFRLYHQHLVDASGFPNDTPISFNDTTSSNGVSKVDMFDLQETLPIHSGQSVADWLKDESIANSLYTMKKTNLKFTITDVVDVVTDMSGNNSGELSIFSCNNSPFMAQNLRVDASGDMEFLVTTSKNTLKTYSACPVFLDNAMNLSQKTVVNNGKMNYKLDYMSQDNKKSIIKLNYWKNRMQKLNDSNLSKFKNNSQAYSGDSDKTGLVFKIWVDYTNDNYRSGVMDEIYTGCDDEERLRTISLDSNFKHPTNEYPYTLADYIDNNRLYSTSYTNGSGYITTYIEGSGQSHGALLNTDVSGSYLDVVTKTGVDKNEKLVGMDLLFGKNKMFDTCIKYDNDYLSGSQNDSQNDVLVRNFGNNRKINIENSPKFSKLKTDSAHSTKNYTYTIEFMPKTDLTNKVLPDIVNTDISGYHFNYGGEAVCLQRGLTTRPRILEEGNLFEKMNPYDRSHGLLRTNGIDSVLNIDDEQTRQLESLTLGKHISRIFNIPNEAERFEPDMIEITRIEHSYRFILNNDPKSVEPITGDSEYLQYFGDISGSTITTILNKITDENVWTLDTSKDSFLDRHLVRDKSPIMLATSMDSHFLSALDNYPAGVVATAGSGSEINGADCDCQHKIKIMVEPVPIGIEVSKPITITSEDLKSFDETHSTNVCSINIQNSLNTMYGLPRANNNPVSIPCATGATLYNYLMNVTKYEELLNALKNMYGEDCSGYNPSENIQEQLLNLLNLPSDVSLLTATDIKTKMTELCKKLTEYKSKMANYNNNKYIGYLVKCEKDLSSGKGNATKYTVLRDRIVISKGENNYDIIDINSSIFGYDMAKLQLPDTNIVFRDTNHSSGSGEMFCDIKITGVNGMNIGLEKPTFTGEENEQFYYLIRYAEGEGMDLSLKVSVVDNIQLTTPTNYDIIHEETKILASGRGPMLISGEDNSFTQNQEMCNRALNIWAMDGYNYTNDMGDTDWFAMKDDKFKTGMERFGSGISTNQKAYNYRPTTHSDMKKGQPQLFINLFLPDSNEFTGQLPITLKDDILYRYYWDVDVSNPAYYFDIKQTQLKSDKEITKILKDNDLGFSSLCNNSRYLDSLGLVSKSHYSTYVYEYGFNENMNEDTITVKLTTDSKQLIREYTSFKDSTENDKFRDYADEPLDKNIDSTDKTILSFEIEKYLLTDISGGVVERYEGDGCTRNISPIFRYPMLHMFKDGNSRVVRVTDSGVDTMTDIDGNSYVKNSEGKLKTREELAGDLTGWTPTTDKNIPFKQVSIQVLGNDNEPEQEPEQEQEPEPEPESVEITVGNVNNNVVTYDNNKLLLTFSHADSYVDETNNEDGFNLFVDKKMIHSCNYYNNTQLPLYSDNAEEQTSLYSLNPVIGGTTNKHTHNAIFDYFKEPNKQNIISSWNTSVKTTNDYIRLDNVDASGCVNMNETSPFEVKGNLDINLNEVTNNIVGNIQKITNLTVEIDVYGDYHLYGYNIFDIIPIDNADKEVLFIDGCPHKIENNKCNAAPGVYNNCVLVFYTVDCNTIPMTCSWDEHHLVNINEYLGKHNYFHTSYDDASENVKDECVEDFNLKLTINANNHLLRGYGQNEQTNDTDLTTTRHLIYPLDKFKITTESTEWKNSSGQWSSKTKMDMAKLDGSIKSSQTGDVGTLDEGNTFVLTYNFSSDKITESPILTGMITNHGENNTNVVYQFGTQKLKISQCAESAESEYYCVDDYHYGSDYGQENLNAQNDSYNQENLNAQNDSYNNEQLFTSIEMIKNYYDENGDLCLEGAIPVVINEINKLFTLKGSTKNKLEGGLRKETLEDGCWVSADGYGNNIMKWTYHPDILLYRCYKNTDHKMVLPMVGDEEWHVLDNTVTIHGNITLSKNEKRTFFPAGHKNGKLYSQDVDNMYKSDSVVDYSRYSDHFPITTNYSGVVPDFEYLGPKLSYKSTNRQYNDTVDSNGSHFTSVESAWIPLEDTHRWITSNDDTHQLDYLNNSLDFDENNAQYRYYLPELYTVICAEQNNSIYSLYETETPGVLADKEFEFQVNKDQLNITYDTRVNPTPTERYTATNVNWNEEQWVNFSSIPDGFSNGDEVVLNKKVHGSLSSRLLYRLNSRLPYVKNNKIVGLKSINRLNLADNDMVISMWHNVRTVTGVSRPKESVDRLNELFYDKREAMDKIDSDAGTLAGFGKKIEHNTDIKFKNMTLPATDTTTNVYQYQHIRNDIPGQEKPDYTMSSVNGSELISIDQSNWKCYAVSTPMPIYKKINKKGEVTFAEYSYDPDINYNINRANPSGKKWVIDGYDTDILKLEKHRIQYLRDEGMISNEISDYFTYGTLNKYKPNTTEEPGNPVFDCEKKMGVRFKLGSTFNVETGSTYLIDSMTNGVPTAVWNDTFLRTSGTAVDGSIDLSLTQPTKGDDNVDTITKLVYRESYDTFTTDSTYLHYKNNDGESNNEDDLTVYYNPYDSYNLENTDKKYELNIPDITKDENLPEDKMNQVFMSSRVSWLCSKGINLWYRDCYRSLDLQSNISEEVRTTVDNMIHSVMTDATLQPNTKKRFMKIKTWVRNHFESLNFEDLLKATAFDGTTYDYMMTGDDDDGSNWNLWPETDSANKNVVSNKICNITEILEKYSGSKSYLQALRQQMLNYLGEYDNKFNSNIGESNNTYKRKDDTNRDINVLNLGDSAIPINKIVDASGAQLYEDHVGVPIRVVRTSHPPGLEHRLDEVESILDNKLSTIPILENRLNGVEGIVRDYENIKTYLASEINNLKNTKIDEQMDNIEQIDQLKQYISNEINSIKSNNENQVQFDVLENNINTILTSNTTDNSSFSKRIEILETNNQELNQKIDQLDNNTLLKTMENNMNDVVNKQINIEQLSSTVNDLASKIENNENKKILNQMITIKDDVLGIKQDVTVLKDEITNTGQKIKKVIKKANIH